MGMVRLLKISEVANPLWSANTTDTIALAVRMIKATVPFIPDMGDYDY